jgi:TolA-binding protein
MMLSIQKFVLAILAAAFPFAAWTQSNASPDATRKLMTDRSIQSCVRVYADEINDGGVRKQFCDCVHRGYYERMSDAQIQRITQNLRKLKDREGTRKPVQINQAEQEQLKRDNDENQRNLAELEQTCMKKYGLSVPSGAEMMWR